MTYEEFKKQLTRETKGAFVFYGDEDYLKRDAVKLARKAIIADPTFAEFCHAVVTDGDIQRAREELSYPTMFSSERLVELYGVEPEKTKESDFRELCEMMKSAECLFILYIEQGKLSEFERAKPAKEKGDKASKKSDTENSVADDAESKKSRFTRLSEAGKLVEFKRQDARRLSKWIARHFEMSGLSISEEATSYMLSLCSSDMFILKNEIEKLIAFAKSKGIVNVASEHIAYVSSRYTEIGAFDFANALLAGNKRAAFEILSDMKIRKEPAQIVLSSVSRIASELLSVKTMLEAGMNPVEIGQKMRMKDYPLRLRIDSVRRKTAEEISLLCEKCYEADITLKSSGADAYTVLENLILYI